MASAAADKPDEVKAPNSAHRMFLPEWQRRCETVLDQLAAYPVIRPHGGWSLLLDTRPLELTASDLSRRLFDRAKVAAEWRGLQDAKE